MVENDLEFLLKEWAIRTKFKKKKKNYLLFKTHYFTNLKNPTIAHRHAHSQKNSSN